MRNPINRFGKQSILSLANLNTLSLSNYNTNKTRTIEIIEKWIRKNNWRPPIIQIIKIGLQSLYSFSFLTLLYLY